MCGLPNKERNLLQQDMCSESVEDALKLKEKPKGVFTSLFGYETYGFGRKLLQRSG